MIAKCRALEKTEATRAQDFSAGSSRDPTAHNGDHGFFLHDGEPIFEVLHPTHLRRV